MFLFKVVPVWLIADSLVLGLAIFFTVFAVSIVVAAVWYHFRQEKDVRLDEEEDEPFQLREDEQEEEDEALEKGPQWSRRD